MFLIGALHNFAGGLGFIVLYSWVYTCCGHEPPRPGIHYQMWIAMIVVFGIAYALIYRQIFAERNLVLVAILAKFVTAVLLGWALIDNGQPVPMTFAVPATSDFLWGILFASFYWYASTNDLWLAPAPDQ